MSLGREIVEGMNIRTVRTNIVHAPGSARAGDALSPTLLLCAGRFSASDIDNAGDAPVTCLWCIAGIPAPDLRWFKWGDEP